MPSLIDNIVSQITGEKKYWTHWQWYKRFFNEGVFKFFVSFITLLPIIAKIFQSPQQASPLLIIESQLKVLFDWKLLWLAAVLYLLSYALYLLFCPKFIKTYNNYKDYTTFLHSPRWLVWLAQGVVNDKRELTKFINRLDIKNYLLKSAATNSQISKQDESEIEVLDKQTILSFTYNGSHYKFGMPILKDGDIDKDATEVAEREIFWELFGRYSSDRKFIRLAISLFLIISVTLFATVVVQYMISMIKYVF